MGGFAGGVSAGLLNCSKERRLLAQFQKFSRFSEVAELREI